MDLQGPQEAVKVEIQCHQDGERKKQQHERQTRVTALSEKQKLAVRGCPVGNAKPLSLIKPPSQSIAISVVPVKPPVSMVTARINGQKAPSSEPPQTTPVSLPAAGKAAGSSSTGRRITELPRSQMLGTLTAVPIKVPQVSSLHRLAGQASNTLPQVRPKTMIPDSLPQSPCQEQQSSQPPSLQRATTVVSPKSRGPGPALPSANSTLSPVQLPNGQASPSPPTPGAGVAYAIISASPSGTCGSSVSTVTEAVKVQPLLFSSDSKVIVIQPQAPSVSQNSPGPQAGSPTQDSPSTPSSSLSSTSPPAPSAPAKKKSEEHPEKTAFMVALGLVTTEHLEEIQSRRQERKRRSTANPAYSSLFEPERKRHGSSYMNSPLFLSAGDTEDLIWKEGWVRDEHCTVCKENGELQPCHSCPRSYHPDCLQPPLKTPPKGFWVCPKCQKKVLNKDNIPWPQNFVQSYIMHKTAREEEKRKLIRRNSELKRECAFLEERDQQLSQSLMKCMDRKSSLLDQQKETQASLDRLKSLIRLIQRDQMIQLTMTATTTTEAPLLSLPWIKPSSTATAPPSGPSVLHQKSVSQSQAND
ncbi:PHD finger protein 21B-like isoform X1 [Brienomyrus brachyistius]|uniref:PHD finger protein 21B-like isoform X1 n=1 Tax=Brienomyrus brachyistius TaxID=42636 RepID=UPI0020B2921B|nr:PHD finger protein 21B-like isoform X1 [Brienomyrus brachyistius]